MDEETTTNGGGYTQPGDYKGFERPTPVLLPSGSTFLLRKPQIMKMLRKGQLPNPLVQIVEEQFAVRDEADVKAEAELKGITEEQVLEERQLTAEAEQAEHPPVPRHDVALTAADGFAFMDVIVWASIAAPRVEMEPPVGDSPLTATGALSYDAISDDDVQFILRWANRDADELATFPPGAGRAAGGGDGGEVRAAPEPPVGHPV